MEKYTIDDLIIDDPELKKKNSKRSTKGKYTTIALIAIILMAGVYIAKMTTGLSTDVNTTEEQSKSKQDTTESIVYETQKEANELSLAITELDSLAPPTESKDEEIVTAKTEELIEQKEETIAPVEQEVQKVADKLSAATAETKSPEPSTTEPKNDSIENNEIVATKTEKLIEQKEETTVPVEQEVEKITDVLSNTTVETKSPEPSVTEPNIDEIIAARIEELPDQKEETIVPVEQEAQKVADELSTATTETKSQDTIKNSTPDTVVPQKSPEIKEEATEPPKQKAESRVNDTPETKTEDTASTIQEEQKINTADSKKVKSKPKQDGFFNLLSNKTKYYILVGSNPSSRFLSNIKNAKLRYVIRISNGKRSVFVGPYSSANNAKRSIGKVQKVTGVKGIVVKAK